MLDKRAFYINGAWSAPETVRDFEVIDPSTEEPCAVISLGDQAEAGSEHMADAINTLRAHEFDRMLGDHAPNDRILMEPIAWSG